MKIVALALTLLFLAACTSTPTKITAMPAAGTPAVLPVPITNPDLIVKLKADAANLDQAVAIGAIPKDDPAPACMHDFLRKAGIELPPGIDAPKSFTPDPAGKASILYIELRQARSALSGPGLQVAPSCFAILGELQFNTIMDAAKAAGLLRGGGVPPLPIPLAR